MTALILYLGSIGFACMPPIPIVWNLPTPYHGPFAMDEELARLQVASYAPINAGRYVVMLDTDPGFKNVHCPPIF